MSTETERRAVERAVDRAIEMTFPASDPIAPKNATSTEPPGAPAPATAVSDKPQSNWIDPATMPDGRPPMPAMPHGAVADPQGEAGEARAPLPRSVCPRCKGAGTIGVYECPACQSEATH
jgi:hypothetical protein